MSAVATGTLRCPATAQAIMIPLDSIADSSKPGGSPLQLSCSEKMQQNDCTRMCLTVSAVGSTGEAAAEEADATEAAADTATHAARPASAASTSHVAASCKGTATTNRSKTSDTNTSSQGGTNSSKQQTTAKAASKPPATRSAKAPSAASSPNSSSSSKPAKAISKPRKSSLTATTAAASTALAATKLGLNEQLATALAVAPAAATLRDVDGRCCLHYAAAYGHEECIDTLLAKGSSDAVRVRDINGDLPLHLAAQKGQPMCAYNIAKACPASCLVKNKRNQTPVVLAASAARGEVLNALLLACAGEGKSAVAVAAMRALLVAGAVPDTWAPNGSSALMLAAAADGVTALEVGHAH
eukprot:GHUV01008478.1.p1 GENE.GHUV01008478.1~~GHUV01008478.1.p1  ORF type:complete len:356 (+),score=151.08 GHUV01008478.1:628-1695(+)